ncbi:FKBP-type peptidyl-prolyl cis-trans isomerase [Citricoccus sp. NPDC079358]|uniref:FKBP-type peptidyl-prolyl cis-trans isomerase n=1 Tax=Citricoccus sp. NPDC079358 TaxID=3154653 RepID=UPI00344E86BB
MSRSVPRQQSRSRRSRAAAPLSLSLVGALLLAGCAAPEPRGAGDIEALEPVSMEVNEEGVPEVTVDGEIQAEEVSSRVLTDGDGEDVNDGDIALVQTAIVDPASGEVTAENFTQGSEAVFLNDALKEGNDVLYNMLDQNKVGAQISFFMPGAQMGQGAPDQLMVFQISDVRPARAEGESVDVTDDSLPAVTLNEDSGEPTIAAPEGDAPTELVVQPLIEGDGEEVGEGDYVTIHYKGVKWSDGEEFDSSWSTGAPAGFQLDQLIAGWNEGLQGQKVGSQVLLVVPPELGYGDSEGNELQDETLVFVVDILHAMAPAEPAEAPEPAEPAPSASAPAESAPAASASPESE